MATVYKQGSSGETVKLIQQALVRSGYKVTADGVYGQKTADAVRAFQRANGLKPVDGIVGSVTMARLMASSVTAKPASADDSLRIVNGHISTHITFCIGRPLKYIAIHYTAGSTSRKGAALSTRNVFISRSASADFVVDDEQIVQINPDIRNYYCWSVGDKKNPYSGGGRLYGVATNKNTISIEVCSFLRAGTTAAVPNHEGWHFSDKALDNTLRLVRHLMKTYNIAKSNVVRHYDVSGKLCPGIIGWNDGVIYTTDGKATTSKSDSEKWKAFWDKI